VVEPEETDVLAEAEDDILTLVTCYPFNFVGSAPQRFIVRAYRIPAEARLTSFVRASSRGLKIPNPMSRTERATCIQ
jgi:sortase (surface protein transpeptidase)